MKKFIYLFILASAMIFAACEKDVIVGPTIVITGQGGEKVQTSVPQNDKGEFAITFGGYNSATKASASSVLGNGYNEFTLYSWNSEGESVMNPFNVKANANGYYYEGVNGQQLQYFKNTSSDYSFIGVIPSSKEMSINNGTVTVKGVKSALYDDNRVNTIINNGQITADSDEEFLYAYTNVAKANYGSVVNLPFEHGNALVYLGFKTTSGKPVELLDYTPTIPANPGSPGTSDTETYTKKSTKFIDELVAGSEVQVAIGFYGANSPKLEKTQPNPLYVGSDNTDNGWLAKTWLLSIKDAVNAQFVYYRLNEVNNSTSKTVTTEDWESAASNKNIFMMKLADGVDKAAFAAGNDAFWNALVAHDAGTTEPWVGGSPIDSFKNMFAQAYADGWRVIRINVSDTNANQVLVFLSSNIEKTTQVCTITPGTPAIPATPATGCKGVRLFTANLDSEHYVHANYTTKADAKVSSNGLLWDNRECLQSVLEFKLPSTTSLNAEPVYSPTTFYVIPGDTYKNFVAKISYKFDGEKVYDVRIPINLPVDGFKAGKYYTYIINIDKKGNGNNVTDAENGKDDIDNNNHPIQVNINVNGYGEGETNVITIP